jgi:hypothetical protein
MVTAGFGGLLTLFFAYLYFDLILEKFPVFDIFMGSWLAGSIF